jgi:hypothetical protein
MHLNLVFSSLSDSDLEMILSESYTFRKSVSEYLLKNKTKKRSNKNKLIEKLKQTIRKQFPDCTDNDKISVSSTIPAIKYFRSFSFSPELKNELKKLGIMDDYDYIGLLQAKKFIESI